MIKTTYDVIVKSKYYKHIDLTKYDKDWDFYINEETNFVLVVMSNNENNNKLLDDTFDNIKNSILIISKKNPKLDDIKKISIINSEIECKNFIINNSLDVIENSFILCFPFEIILNSNNTIKKTLIKDEQFSNGNLNITRCNIESSSIKIKNIPIRISNSNISHTDLTLNYDFHSHNVTDCWISKYYIANIPDFFLDNSLVSLDGCSVDNIRAYYSKSVTLKNKKMFDEIFLNETPILEEINDIIDEVFVNVFTQRYVDKNISEYQTDVIILYPKQNKLYTVNGVDKQSMVYNFDDVFQKYHLDFIKNIMKDISSLQLSFGSTQMHHKYDSDNFEDLIISINHVSYTNLATKNDKIYKPSNNKLHEINLSNNELVWILSDEIIQELDQDSNYNQSTVFILNNFIYILPLYSNTNTKKNCMLFGKLKQNLKAKSVITFTYSDSYVNLAKYFTEALKESSELKFYDIIEKGSFENYKSTKN